MQIFELQTGDYDDIYTNGVSNGTVDVAFRKISKNATNFLIWKVENMGLVSIPRDQYGIFYDDDSYIIFASSIYGQPVGAETVYREVKGQTLEYHIHFWLGSSTTPDKSGVAAYKTVELDTFLNCCSIQHRETQDNESARFRSYFKTGIRILKSDTLSKDICSPRLFKIKGKSTPILTQVEKISWDAFNSSQIFMLQTPNCLFVWVGRATDTAEKLNATKIATKLKEELNIQHVAFVDDGYEKTLQDEDKKEFNKYLPLDKRRVLPENGLESEEEHKTNLRLYRCCENNGKYRVAEIKTGTLHQTDLESDDVFIIDQETNGIWVWVGKRVNEKEKTEALRNARGFVKKKKYPNKTKVTRVVEGYEPQEFKMLFAFWKSEKIKNGKLSNTLVAKFDAITLEERPSLAAETQLIDDGSGKLTVWRIKQNSFNEVPKERHGIFFSGDCYIVLYVYPTSNDQKYLFYYWLGANATQEEITCAATKICEIEDEFDGLTFRGRIIQGREPPHFLQIFKGKLMVFLGKGTDFDESGKNLKYPTQYFMQVFGSTLASSKAVQIQAKSSFLNSNYCFVLKRGKKSTIWCGNYSTGDQKEMAKLFAGKDFELIIEGKEKDEFFDLLGGKSMYTTQLSKFESDPRPPRLFHCYKINGVLKVDEIFFFEQCDLLPENVMMLDFYNVVYLWIGKMSSKEDQRHSTEYALNYLQADPCGRDMNLTLIHVKQGREPPTFKGFFPVWKEKFWKNYKSFGRIRQEIEKKSSPGKETNGYSTQKSGHNDFDQYDKYPISILKEPNDKLPARVDALNKELHLTHDDFVTLLKMPYIEFEKLPRWKQQELKKRVGLF